MNKLEYTVLPTCPVCGEVTYKGEDLKILIENATKKGYLIADDGDGIDTAYLKTSTRAWLDGFEIEQEKLYTVEIPDPHGMYKNRYLFRNSEGNIRIGASDYRDIFLDEETHLTESEIKQDFEWAWQWAKEVEEWWNNLY